MLHSLPKDTDFATLKESANFKDTNMLAELTIGENTVLATVEEFLTERGYNIEKGQTEIVDPDGNSLATEIKFNLIVKAL